METTENEPATEEGQNESANVDLVVESPAPTHSKALDTSSTTDNPSPSNKNGQKRKSDSSSIDTINEQTSRLELSKPQNESTSDISLPTPLITLATMGSSIATREKRIRKQKAYDDDYVTFNPLPSMAASYRQEASNAQPQTPNQQQQQPQTSSADTSPPLEPCPYNIGDVVWAKLNGHPWWPCMISTPMLHLTNTSKQTSPTSPTNNANSHTKLVGTPNSTRRFKRMLYVEFYGLGVEHAWVAESCVLVYEGLEHFKEFTQRQIDAQTTKSSREKSALKYSLKVPVTRRRDWDAAVKEADLALVKRPFERKLAFQRKHSATKSGSNKARSASASTFKDADELQEDQTGGEEDSENPNAFSDNDKYSANKQSKKRHHSNKESSISPLSERSKTARLTKKLVKGQDNASDASFEDDQSTKKSKKRADKISDENEEDADEEDEDEQSELKKRKKKTLTNLRNKSGSSSFENIEDDDNMSEEKMIRLIKNRLSAITCMDNDILNLSKIAKKYNINKHLLMKDYFGFTGVEETVEIDDDRDEFYVRLDQIRRELESMKSICGGDRIDESAPKIITEESAETLPKSLVAIKFQIPLVYLNKIAEYLKSVPSKIEEKMTSPSNSPKNVVVSTEEMSSEVFFANLFELKCKMYANRHDLKMLNEIVNQDKSKSLVNVVESEMEINEKIEEPIKEENYL